MIPIGSFQPTSLIYDKNTSLRQLEQILINFDKSQNYAKIGNKTAQSTSPNFIFLIAYLIWVIQKPKFSYLSLVSKKNIKKIKNSDVSNPKNQNKRHA